MQPLRLNKSFNENLDETTIAKQKEKDEQTRESLPWVEKFRPTGLDDLVAHDEIISILNRLISSNKLPHLLFYGPPGTGKTSTILACAKQMYGPKSYGMMTLELNASDDRGIDVVRDQIKEFAGTKRLFSSGIKLVILDEADAMTSDAQFALRRVIEKYTKTTRFCLICNYVSKIIPALQSRCTRFRFAPLREEHVLNRIEYVAGKENLEVKPEGAQALVNLAGGDMRRVLNIMQSTAMANQVIEEEAVYLSAGNPLPKDVETILNHLLNSSFQTAYNSIKTMTTLKGYSLTDILKDLTQLLLYIEVPDGMMAHIFKSLATIEYRLASGASESIQLAAVVGTFAYARGMLPV